MCDKAVLEDISTVRVRALIDESKKTREEIGRGIDIDTSTVTKYYNGDRKLTVEAIKKFSKFFNVSADYLLGLSDAKTNDKELQAICDYTGLSEHNAITLHNVQDMDFINFMVSKLTERLCNYVASYNCHINWANVAIENIDELMASLFAESQDVRLKENYYDDWHSHISGLLRRIETSDLSAIQHFFESIELDIYRLLMATNSVIDEYFAPSKNAVESRFKKINNDYQEKRAKILSLIGDKSIVDNPEKGDD